MYRGRREERKQERRKQEKERERKRERKKRENIDSTKKSKRYLKKQREMLIYVSNRCTFNKVVQKNFNNPVRIKNKKSGEGGVDVGGEYSSYLV